ncbi:MAG: hypothetical protein RIK87_28605 [Fuerstiella sp.]
MVATIAQPTARWSSETPLGFEAGDTNLRRYVGNSPPNATDPDGLQERRLPTINISTPDGTDVRSLGSFFQGTGQEYDPTSRNKTVVQRLYESYDSEDKRIFEFATFLNRNNEVDRAINQAGLLVAKIVGEEVSHDSANKCFKKHKTVVVDVFGWSRGGYAAAMFSNRLAAEGVNVNFATERSEIPTAPQGKVTVIVRFAGIVDAVNTGADAFRLPADRLHINASDVCHATSGGSSAADSTIFRTDHLINHGSNPVVSGKSFSYTHAAIGWRIPVFEHLVEQAKKKGVPFK